MLFKMEGFLTNQQKLDFVRSEFLKMQNSNNLVSWDNSRLYKIAK